MWTAWSRACLGVSRYQAGVLALNRQACRFSDLVDRAVRSLWIPRRRCDCRLDRDTMVDVDPLLIEQVMVNLLENAHKYGPPGTPVVIEAARDGARLRVSVVDRGPGIPPAHHPHMFDGFIQFGGRGRAGLGLSIAKTFLEAHGQRIWVDGEVREGAKFTFTLHLMAGVPAEFLHQPAAAVH